jgi:lysophospholipase
MIEETSFQDHKGGSLFTRRIVADKVSGEGRDKALGLVMIVHGLGEHSGRYLHVSASLADRGFVVYAPDLRGHGRSKGLAGNMGRFSNILKDLRMLQIQIQERFPSLPFFLLGHSLGALLCLLYIIRYQEDISGAIISSGFVRLPKRVPSFLVRLISLLAVLLPLLPIYRFFSLQRLSRDVKVIREAEEDPLYHRGLTRARTAREIFKAVRELQHSLPLIRIPLLILHGTADQIVKPECSEILYGMVNSSDKTLYLLDNLYHEVLNEPEKEKVLALAGEWLERVAESANGY